MHVASPSRLRPQSVRDLFRMKGTPACRKSMAARARLGGDVDVDLNGEAIGEDFYSVLGLVRDLKENYSMLHIFGCQPLVKSFLE